MKERFAKNINEFLRRQSRLSILLFAILAVIVVGLVDYFTGPEIGISIFYLIPICAVAWYQGRNAGLFISGFSAVAWLVAELMWEVNYRNPITPFWNAVVRLGLFVVSGALTAEVAERKRIEEVLRQQTNVLESILNSMGDGVIVTDLTGNVLLSNPAADRLLLGSFKNLNFKVWLQEQSGALTVVEFPTSVRKGHPLERALAGETIDGVEMVLRDVKGGNEVWLNATGRPLVDEYTGTRGEVIVFSDITGRKILEKQIAEISEREQRRIGQDLHDGLCQHLVSTAFAATLLQRKLEEKAIAEASAAEQIADMINEGISQARGMARGLHPVRLEEDGLAPALEQLAEMTQMLTGISCEFHVQGEVIINDPIAAANLYRIAQEAVNNSLKHAKAEHISVDLEAVEEEITLTIRDDGIGITKESGNRGMGLYIMNHRARLIGASLDIRRAAVGGTIVNCSFLNTKSLQHPHA